MYGIDLRASREWISNHISSPALDDVRELDVHVYDPPGLGFIASLALARMPSLTRLSLADDRYQRSDLEEFCSSGAGDNLRHLGIRGTRLGPAMASELAAASWANRLASLELKGNDLGSDGAAM
ncbi:MAG: hypothetical protein SFU53_09635, partial [Terrimicrobiaceae bacterium]|nr:hypothetical protein [Terrimicrobiaceae bacterium]